MKKVFCDNWLAKALLCMSSCHTITVGPFVLSKRAEEKITQEVRNHECTHARQWVEMAVVSGALIWWLVLLSGLSAWWMALSPLAFYLWYGIEWIVRSLIYSVAGPGGERKSAYRMVSFEQEAYGNEADPNYLENSDYFAWVDYLSK